MQAGGDVTLALHHAHAARPPLLELVKDAMSAASPAGSVRPEPEVPEPDDEGPLYGARRKIYPQRVKGTYRTIKWIVLFVTLGIYYGLPFVRWAQEIYYLTGLLILAAMTLFLMNAVAGRVWCGYLCPQTVWTDLFQTI